MCHSFFYFIIKYQYAIISFDTFTINQQVIKVYKSELVEACEYTYLDTVLSVLNLYVNVSYLSELIKLDFFKFIIQQYCSIYTVQKIMLTVYIVLLFI